MSENEEISKRIDTIKQAITGIYHKFQDFSEKHPKATSFLLYLTPSLLIAGTILLIPAMISTDPLITGIPPSPLTPSEITQAAYGVIEYIILMTLLFVVIPVVHHYYRNYRQFRESVKNWQTAEDELIARKEYQRKEHRLYGWLFMGHLLLISPFALFLPRFVIGALLYEEIESGIQLTSQSAQIFWIWYMVLLITLLVYGLFAWLYWLYSANPEKFQEGIQKLKMKKKEEKNNVL